MAAAGVMDSFDDDDLEYHITFPSPTPRPAYCSEADDFVYVGEAKEPVVFLLGWAGCLDKHLSKYSALYEVKGCITIRYSPSAHEIFFNPAKFERVAMKLLELLSDLNLEEHDVIFHMFSNGGCFVYRHISSFICNDPDYKVRIRGCIFDSGPAINSLFTVTKAAMNAATGHWLYRYAIGFVTFLYILFTGTFDYVASLIWNKSIGSNRGVPWHRLAKEPLRCPQLFLFSKADDICSYQSIQEFADRRRKLEVPVETMCWEDSPHVNHLRFHALEYTDKVHNFLDMCVTKELGLDENTKVE